MLFSSIEFIFYFLPIAVAGYYFLNRYPLQFLPGASSTKLWLLLCSLFFYGWWNPRYLPLLLGSILFNYGIALLMQRAAAKEKQVQVNLFLGVGVVANIALLAWFKYANFLVDNLNLLLAEDLLLAKVIFPLGISFFTIQQIAFLMDSSDPDAGEQKNLLDYALFVTFFPHLLAGPILHHREMMPQFHDIKPRFFNARHFALGCFVFSVGLFKKVVIADSLAPWVESGYALKQIGFVDAWLLSLSYTFQLYFDFSGYVDMAIGAALLFNIKLPQNFNSPYRATSLIRFWECWHITLSRFITAYIYTPLLRAFPGPITFYKSLLAIFIAMVMAGLWHGPAWCYVLFGAFHGAGLVINHLWRRLKITLPYALGWLLTFAFVNMSFVIFRSGSVEQAWQVISALLAFGPTGLAPQLAADWRLPLALVLLLGLCLGTKGSHSLADRFRPDWRYGLGQLLLLLIPLFMMNRVIEFVYFQF